jgi:Leucine-rich repeat (LRR) protein
MHGLQIRTGLNPHPRLNAKTQVLRGDTLVHILSYIEKNQKPPVKLVDRNFYEANIIRQFVDYKERNLLCKYIPKEELFLRFPSLERMAACVKIVTSQLQKDNNLNRIFPCILEQLPLEIQIEGHAIIEGNLSITEKASQIRLFLETHQTECSQISTLVAVEIGLTMIPSEVCSLTNLRELILADNEIRFIPPEFTSLINLRTLDLSGNKISFIPPEISSLTNLKDLDLCSNKIPTIPPEISALTNLESLGLSNNEISVISPEIRALINLTVLSLSLNQISIIPPEIGALTNLMHLSLCGNKISAIPPEIGALINLALLDLPHNQISALPPEIGALRNLIYLYLNHNQISVIPPEIRALTNLTELLIYENQIPRNTQELIKQYLPGCRLPGLDSQNIPYTWCVLM